MNRLALIIDGSDIPGETRLPGAKKDAQQYINFLRSSCGGAWENNEIQHLSNPSRGVVKAWCQKFINYDYVFAVYSGHGRQERYGSVLIALNDGELDIYSLQALRGTVVADCCRHLPQLEVVQEDLRFNIQGTASVARESGSRARHRALFDIKINSAEKGTVYIFSCGEDSGAEDDNPNFGSFSQALIACAQDWKSSTLATRQDAVFSIRDAFECAENKVMPNQQPEIKEGRRRASFPFAVKAMRQP